MTQKASVTTQLILHALRPQQTAAAWRAAWEQAGGNWDDLAVRAIVFGLAPQLHRRFTEWELDVPPRPAGKLAVTHQAQAQRNDAIFAQVDEILAACAAEGIRPIALKGVHLAADWYPEPALRPMNDIDLLFAPAGMAAVAEILAALGYAGKHKAADLGAGVTKHTSTFRRGDDDGAGTPNPYLSPELDRTVEPHISLEESWYGLTVDVTPGMRARAVTVTLPGAAHPAGALAPDDLLLHLCVHACFHLIMGAPSLVQLTDLGVVAGSGRVTWPVFVARARAYGAMPYALAALTLAQNLLGAPVPAGVLDQLAQGTPRHLRRHVAQLDLAAVLARTQQQPWTTTWERVRQGLRDRAETARWAPDWRSKLRVWGTTLQIARSDTGRALLQRVTGGK